MLADRAPVKAFHGHPCSVAQLLNTLTDTERDALEAMLAPGSGWQHTAIWEACTAEGYKVAYQQVGRHRNGQCRCSQATT